MARSLLVVMFLMVAGCTAIAPQPEDDGDVDSGFVDTETPPFHPFPIPPLPSIGDYLFSGYNIYAPTLIYADGICEMWYGGWQEPSDYNNDNIYYRTSVDCLNWSDPITVLTPEELPNSYHVNDASVTRHFNTANGMWQYTMFFTSCAPPCNGYSDSQIWSSVSADGLSWSNHQMLLEGGPSDPSAAFEDEGWWVYYVDRLDQEKVRKVRVDGNRTVASDIEVVYIDPGVIGNVEVVGNEAYFNRFTPIRVDIYKTVNWGTATLVIEPQGVICAATTPAVLDGYVYFGQHYLVDGVCPINRHGSIQRLALEGE